MIPAASLDRWIAAATRGLCDDAGRRIRAEITDHYSAALDAGQPPEAALESFGNPKKANRKYRTLYPTLAELLSARVLGSLSCECIVSLIFLILPMQVVMGVDPYLWYAPPSLADRRIVLALSSMHLVLRCFFPVNSATRARNYWWVTVGQLIAISFIIGPTRVVFGTWFLLVFYLTFAHERLKFHRKLGSTPLPRPDPSTWVRLFNPSDRLTEMDVLRLQELRQPISWCNHVLHVLPLLIGAFCTWYWPWAAGPLTLYLACTFALPLCVPINTPERGRLFRRAKWLLFAATAVVSLLAFLWVTKGRTEYRSANLILYVVFSSMAPLGGERARLRRKLPADQWPGRLYR